MLAKLLDGVGVEAILNVGWTVKRLGVVARPGFAPECELVVLNVLDESVLMLMTRTTFRLGAGRLCRFQQQGNRNRGEKHLTVWSCGGRGAEVVHALICWLTLTVGNQKHALVV